MPILKFVTWIAGKVMEEAERELYGPEKIQAELVNLSMQLDAGEISEDEYNHKETELLDRLEVSQKTAE